MTAAFSYVKTNSQSYKQTGNRAAKKRPAPAATTTGIYKAHKSIQQPQTQKPVTPVVTNKIFRLLRFYKRRLQQNPFL